MQGVRRVLQSLPLHRDYKPQAPCEMACKIKAISMNENKAAAINYDKCISCGACVYQCPFGAITDKSYMLDVIDIIKKSENNTKYKVFAVVAPSISSQFTYAKLGQVIKGLKELGFHTVIEAALGADMVAYAESEELAEKGFLTSSCCPAFVNYIENPSRTSSRSFPTIFPPWRLYPNISKNMRRPARLYSSVPARQRKRRFRRTRSSPMLTRR